MIVLLEAIFRSWRTIKTFLVTCSVVRCSLNHNLVMLWAMTLSQSEGGVYPSSELFQHFDTKIKAYQLLQHACLTLYRLKKNTNTWSTKRNVFLWSISSLYSQKCLQTYCFAKFLSSMYINWVANLKRTEQRKVSFIFQSFCCFLVQRLTSFSASGWGCRPLILRFTQLYNYVINAPLTQDVL